MEESELNITDASQEICQVLIDTEQTIPKDSLFRDDLFDETCQVYKAKRSPSFSGYVSTDMSVCRNSSHLQCYETQVIDRQCQPRLEKFHPCDEDTSTARLFCGVQTICSKNLNHLLQASTILLFLWPCTTCTSRSLHAK